MVIRAEIEGGPTLEFPDGTDQSIVQDKVKQYTPQQPQKENGMLERIGDIFQEQGQESREMIERVSGGSVAKGLFEAPTIAANQAALLTSGVADTVGELAKPVVGFLGRKAGEFTPDIVKEIGKDTVNYWADTPVGDMAKKATEMGIESFDEFKKQFPDTAIQAEGLLKAWGLGLLRSGGKATVKEIGKTGRDIKKAAMSAEQAEKSIGFKMKKTVAENYQKAIKTRNIKQVRTPNDRSAFFDDITKGFEEIVSRKKSLQLLDKNGNTVRNALPENLPQLAQAIEQTKKSVYSIYDDLARQTNTKISVDNTVKALEKHVSTLEKSANPARKRGISLARKWIDDLRAKGSYDSAIELQDEIKRLNESLNTFYSSKQPNFLSNALVEDVVVHNLRKDLYSAVSSATGGGDFERYRKIYKALLKAEDGVSKRLNTVLNKADSNFLDVGADMVSSTQAAYAIATTNPKLFVASGAAQAVRHFHRMLNNPDRKIRTMFQKMNRLNMQKELIRNDYQSKAFKALKR